MGRNVVSSGPCIRLLIVGLAVSLAFLSSPASIVSSMDLLLPLFNNMPSPTSDSLSPCSLTQTEATHVSDTGETRG